jgi:hypothetical protein
LTSRAQLQLAGAIDGGGARGEEEEGEGEEGEGEGGRQRAINVLLSQDETYHLRNTSIRAGILN